jgi:hypothetical protein
MIDVARDVRARRSVDGPARIHLEPVAIVGPRIALCVRQQRAGVFDDVGVLLDRLRGEHAKSGTRSSDTEHAPSEHLRIVLGTQFLARHRAGEFTSFCASLTRVRPRGQRAADRCEGCIHKFDTGPLPAQWFRHDDAFVSHQKGPVGSKGDQYPTDLSLVEYSVVSVQAHTTHVERTMNEPSELRAPWTSGTGMFAQRLRNMMSLLSFL